MSIKIDEIIILAVIVGTRTVTDRKLHMLVSEIEIMESFTSTTVCQAYRSLIVRLPGLCSGISIFYLNPIVSYFNGIIDDMVSAALNYISANVIAVRLSGLSRNHSHKEHED